MRRLPDRLTIAKSNMLAAKSILDEAANAYLRSVEVYQKQLEAMLLENSEPLLGEDKARQPKGRVEKLVRNYFLNGSVRGGKFANIKTSIENSTGEKLSSVTLRKTLYRLEDKNVLENHSGQWSAGQNLKSA